jgi:hypothetical protein
VMIEDEQHGILYLPKKWAREENGIVVHLCIVQLFEVQEPITKTLISYFRNFEKSGKKNKINCPPHFLNVQHPDT